LGCEPGRGAAILFVTAAFSCSSSAKSFSISLYEEILGIFLSIVMMELASFAVAISMSKNSNCRNKKNLQIFDSFYKIRCRNKCNYHLASKPTFGQKILV
jgi:hypothetical protein